MSAIRCAVVHRSIKQRILSSKYLRFVRGNLNEFVTATGEVKIPRKEYMNESVTKKRARLHWQSRKRGISENCLIFSTFSAKYLNNFSEDQIDIYDKILNQHDNDWELYYWMVGAKPVPLEYQSEIMTMLQDHCRNTEKEERFVQPPLKYDSAAEPK